MKRNTHSVAEVKRAPSGRTRRHHVGAAVAGMQDQERVGAVGVRSSSVRSTICNIGVGRLFVSSCCIREIAFATSPMKTIEGFLQ